MHRVFLFHERGVKGNSRCSVAAMATFCLLSACKDAPLGQRQGGVFRLPPPYLWTPPTPQRAKGCTPLTILKKKSKHKKASAAPVGAIALTLFSLLRAILVILKAPASLKINPQLAAKETPSHDAISAIKEEAAKEIAQEMAAQAQEQKLQQDTHDKEPVLSSNASNK